MNQDNLRAGRISQWERIYLLVLVFFSGAAVMVLEITGSRLLAPYFGNTIYVWGSLIGVVLASLSIGYFIGGKLSDRRPSLRWLNMVVVIAGMAVLIVPFLSHNLLAGISGIGQAYGPLVAAVAILGLPSALLGMITPYALRLYAKGTTSLGTSAGNLYGVSTAGSIAGTFITTFVLIPSLNVTYIFFLISMVIIMLGIVHLRRKAIVTSAVIIMLIAIPSYMLMFNHAINVFFDKIRYKKVFEANTMYSHIVVADDRVSGNQRILFIDSHPHSSMYLDNSSETTFRYPYYFMLAMGYADVKDVLFIGGGGFSSPKKFLNDFPDVNIDVVEIDPKVVDVARKYFDLPDDPRLNVHVADGRAFIRNTDKKYDAIIIDAYSGSYIPTHLLTKEFFESVRSRLNPGGVVVSNFISSLTGDLSKLLRSEYGTLQEVFQDIDLYPVGEMPGISQNVIIMASDTNQSREDILMRLSRRIPHDYARYAAMVEREYKVPEGYGSGTILTDEYTPLHNYINPVSGDMFLPSTA